MVRESIRFFHMR